MRAIINCVIIGTLLSSLLPESSESVGASVNLSSVSKVPPGTNIWEGRNPSVAWKDFPDRDSLNRMLKNCTIRDIMRIYKKPRGLVNNVVAGNEAILSACWIDKPYSGSRFFRDIHGQMWQKPWRLTEYATDDEGVLPEPRVINQGCTLRERGLSPVRSRVIDATSRT